MGRTAKERAFSNRISNWTAKQRGTWIRRKREIAGYQDDCAGFAKLIGVSRVTLWRYENGITKRIPVGTLNDILAHSTAGA